MRILIASGMVFMLVFIGECAHGAEPIDAKWLEKIRTDGRAANAKYEEVSRRIEERYSTETKSIAPPDAPKLPIIRASKSITSVSHLRANILVEQSRWLEGAPTPHIQLQGESDRYAFTLSKKSEDSVYAIAQYKSGQQNALSQSLTGMHFEAFDPFRNVLAAADGKENRQLTEVQWDAEKSALRVGSKMTLKGGEELLQTLWVDPQSSWRTIRYTRKNKFAQFATELDYGAEIEGLRFPTTITITSRFVPEKAAMDNIMTLRSEYVRLTDKSESAFTLSAFGLPEPVGVSAAVEASRTPRYWYYLGAAVPCGPGDYPFMPAKGFDDPCGMFHFWSPHAGGANFAFADGSVRFLSYSADPIMPALATRAGGEAVSIPE